MEESELGGGIALGPGLGSPGLGRRPVRLGVSAGDGRGPAPGAAGVRRGSRHRASAWRARYKPRRRRYRRRLRPGTGTVPLQSNRNPSRLAATGPLRHPYAVAQHAPRSGRGSRTRASVARFPAVAAEPPGPGMGRARDPLAREVRFLGALLGQVIAEQAGPELFALVERIRRRTIALRRADPASTLEPDARTGAPGRRDRVARPRPRRCRGTGVHALLPARQPRRGAPADPDAALARPARPRPAHRRLDRGRDRAAPPGARPGGRPGARRRRRRPPGPHRAPHGGPPAHAARRAPPGPPPARRARRPADDARRGRRPAPPPARGDHARCGTPATSGR